jgi:hypothetical protein
MFLSLADDERMHAEMIQRQLHAIEGDGLYVLLPDLSAPAIDLDAKLFPPAQQEVEKKVGVNPSEIDALHVALENEIKSYDSIARQPKRQPTRRASRCINGWPAPR